MQTAMAKISTLYPASTTMLPSGRRRTAANPARPEPIAREMIAVMSESDAEHHGGPLVLRDPPQRKADPVEMGKEVEDEEGQ